MSEDEKTCIEVRCFGQIIIKKEDNSALLSKPPYCNICLRDDKNSNCPWYVPVKINLFYVYEKRVD